MPTPLTVATTKTTTASAGDPAAVAIAYARAQQGKPYKWGATGPDAYDCSGLVQAAFKAAGISLPRTSYQQITAGTKVDRADLQPGDLVFPNLGHVQIYTGNGQIIESPHAGATVVERPSWGFLTARRVTTPTAATTGTSAPSGTPATNAGFSLPDLNPTTWGNQLQDVGLKLAVVGAGLGLLLLGAARLVAPTVGAVAKELL